MALNLLRGTLRMGMEGSCTVRCLLCGRRRNHWRQHRGQLTDADQLLAIGDVELLEAAFARDEVFQKGGRTGGEFAEKLHGRIFGSKHAWL